MTRKQARFLLRKGKIAVVIGAMAYLAAGVTSLGSPRKSVQESMAHPAIEARVKEPNRTEAAVGMENVDNAEKTAYETEYQSIIYSHDWDSEDARLLCKIAMAEAGNQDTEGKALVMLVVLNRVWGDNEFPDTIKDVLYQPRQFSPVSNGTFESAVPDEDCMKALSLVESGWDESQGALYFDSKSESTWHEDNLKFLFQHGDHYFYTERD